MLQTGRPRAGGGDEAGAPAPGADLSATYYIILEFLLIITKELEAI